MTCFNRPNDVSSFLRVKTSRVLRLLIVPVAAVTLPACTSLFMPYEDEFSCKNDDHGKCIHPQLAHDESVALSGNTPGFQALPAESAARAGTPRGDQVIKNVRRVRRNDDPVRFAVGQKIPDSHTPYTSYQTAVYKQITTMLEDPRPPVMQAATQVRTLILPYADRNRPDRLYMPRFVYSVVSGPRWVLGQYKTRAASEQLPAAFDQGTALPLRALPANAAVPTTPTEKQPKDRRQQTQSDRALMSRQNSTEAAKSALDRALADNSLAALLEGAGAQGDQK